MARVARVTIAGCALLALAACGRQAGAAAEPSTSTTTVPASTSTVVTSTTSAPTTTLSPDQHDEVEIRALHDRFFRMLVVTANPPDPNHPEIAATTTGIERQRWTEFLNTMVDLDQHAEGDVRARVVTVRMLDASHASIQDCEVSEASLLGNDGHVVEGHRSEPHVTELRTVRSANAWRVEDWFTGSEATCEA